MSQLTKKAKRLNEEKREGLTARILQMKEEGFPTELNGEVSQAEYLRSMKDEIMSLKEMGFSFEAIAKNLSEFDGVEISASTIAYAMKSEKGSPKVAKSRKKKTARPQTESPETDQADSKQTDQTTPAQQNNNTAENAASNADISSHGNASQVGAESTGKTTGARRMTAGVSRHEDKTDPFKTN